MTKQQMRMELEDAGLLLNCVAVEGEKNLNNLLCALQKIRRVKNAVREGEDDDQDGQGENV